MTLHFVLELVMFIELTSNFSLIFFQLWKSQNAKLLTLSHSAKKPNETQLQFHQSFRMTAPQLNVYNVTNICLLLKRNEVKNMPISAARQYVFVAMYLVFFHFYYLYAAYFYRYKAFIIWWYLKYLST